MDNKHASRDTASVKIDGVKYELRLLNTSAAFNTFESITKLLLPATGAAIDGASDKFQFDGDQTCATAAMLLVKQLGDVDTLELIKTLLEGAEVEGEDLDFEEHFKGRFDLLIDLLTFAVKENYGSLFTTTGLRDKFKTFVSDLIPQTQEQPQSEESA